MLSAVLSFAEQAPAAGAQPWAVVQALSKLSMHLCSGNSSACAQLLLAEGAPRRASSCRNIDAPTENKGGHPKV